jgi:hypothetical protein
VSIEKVHHDLLRARERHEKDCLALAVIPPADPSSARFRRNAVTAAEFPYDLVRATRATKKALFPPDREI